MNKLIKKGSAIAKRKAAATRTEVKSALEDSLPDRFSVESHDEGVTVSGRGLSKQLIENSSLRDVAFLMRGVR